MLKNYLKIAFKVFLRRKFFTFVSLFGICFTLAVIVAAAAYLDCFIGAHPPEVNKGRTLKITWVAMTMAKDFDNNSVTTPSYRFLDRYVRTLKTPEKVCVYSLNRLVVAYAGDEKIELALKYVDSAYWEVLQFDFLEGRPFTAQEDAEGAPVAVISAQTCRRTFGGGNAAGKIIEMDSERFRVVGVVEEVARVQSSAHAEVWVPVGSAPPEVRDDPSLHGRFEALLLARIQADIPRIKEEYQTTLARVEPSEPRYEVVTSAANTPFEEVAWYNDGWKSYREGYHKWRLLLIWTGAAMLFMSLPALNLINLNLSRILERASEIGVRKAFGASSHSLVVQFAVENLLLTLIGGVLGFALSYLVLYTLAQGFNDFQFSFGMGLRVFALGLLATVFFGVFSGGYPAWRMSRLQPAQALRGGK